MKKIVLLRHGESAWNRENRFTGWTDVDLTDKGVEEALKAGELLKAEGFRFGKAYTSYLKRAVRTLNCVLDRLDQEWIPVEKNWRLNEKHYGVLQGLNKSETAARFGEEQVHIWRRSYDVAPDPLAEDDPRNPRFDPRYAGIPDEELPRTESLKQTIERALPYWQCVIFPAFVIHQEIAQVTVIIKLNHFAVLTTDVDYRARCWLKKPCAQPVTGDFRHLFIGKIHQLPSVAGERQKRRVITPSASKIPLVAVEPESMPIEYVTATPYSISIKAATRVLSCPTSEVE